MFHRLFHHLFHRFLSTRFFHKKSMSPQTRNALPRRLTGWQLTLMGVGSTLGTGIFFVLAETVPLAGPGVVLAFVIAAITAGLTALCYAEVACALPVSGSSYTFTYVTLGEGMAVLVAACLVLEWGIASAAVAVGWSAYLNELIGLVAGEHLPKTLSQSPFISHAPGLTAGSGGYVNLPAVVLVWLCTLLLLQGSQTSARLNAVLTVMKLVVLMLFVMMTLQVFNHQHFKPFLPFGLEGVSAASAIVFFSFVGLDSVVNASEEVINPSRNIPLAIGAALLIVSTVYVLVTIASVGVQPMAAFVGRAAGLTAILHKATGAAWSSVALAIGALVSIFSVTLVALYGQARIYFAMARDGLLPQRLSHVHRTTQCPRNGTLLSALMVSPLAGFLPSHVLWGLVSMGTLVAFMAVAISLMVLRHRQARAGVKPTGFRVPAYPLIPLASLAACLYLTLHLDSVVYAIFALWMALSLAAYAMYTRYGRCTALKAG